MDTVHPERQTVATSRAATLLLVALLVVSFGLRLWDASHGLHAGRYFDERFTLRNVTQILEGDFKPRHAFYLSLSYLPQSAVLAASQGLYRLTGIEALSIYSEKAADRYSPTAYLLCRLCNVIFGLVSLWVTFLIGRRAFSPWVGLLGAAALSGFHRHVLSSTEFKPDILVVMLTSVTLWWALEAALRPTLGRYLRAGVGVGLAVSAKYTGIACALPVAAAALSHARRDRRQIGWLVLAGIASFLTFLVLNPFLDVVFRFIPKLVTGYARHGVAEKSNHWVVFVRQIDFLVVHHGWLAAAFVALGTAWMLWRLLRRSEQPPEQRLGSILLLSLFVGYSLVHSAGMTLFRGQNYLPVVPASSLIAAWAMVESWRALARRLPALRTRPAAVALWTVVGLLFVLQQGWVVYTRVIPTNWQVARLDLTHRLAPIELRHIAYEKTDGALRLGNRNRALTTAVERLDQVDPALLDAADAEVFGQSRLDGPAAGFYRRRVERLAPAQVEVVKSRPFSSRGEPVLMLLHPWEHDGAPVELAVERQVPRFVSVMLPPGLRPGDEISLVLWVPKGAH
ncbi:MAG TPA: glycosyltransferase family 39 protein, partial [Thermoanaerobaculia bacterium]|nr:glycosyltransferase family 39 protein [Thermoanaerobaculia bacterium]